MSDQKFGIRIKWLGCACFEMDFGGVTVVNDPWITGNAKTELTWEDVEKCDYITLTHGHYDHTGATKSLQNMTGAKIYATANCTDIANSYKSMAFAFGAIINKFTTDVVVKEGDIITIGDMVVKVIETAGHTKGGACFILGDNIFSGDTLFQTSYGRTDLPTGDFNALEKSLKKLFALEGDYKVYPGHGPYTTLDTERKHNLIKFND